MTGPLRVVIVGLSITSSWGNGHATNFRGLTRALVAAGHDVLFVERDVPWYAEHRDLPELPWGRVELYASTAELTERFAADVADADLVIVGSYVPEGIDVAAWVLATARGVTAFYDIDTPVTMSALAAGTCEYLCPQLMPQFDLYLSFTGGPTLDELHRRWGVRRPRAFYCLVDELAYRPQPVEQRWDLGYLGTYSADRQPALECLLVDAAREAEERRFVVAGPQYPPSAWPDNVERLDHVAPPEHPAFYGAQRFTLNITRADMTARGWSPSVRLFEAAACGVPIISDLWDGMVEFFVPGREILIARSTDDVLRFVRGTHDDHRLDIATKARERVLTHHTAAHRVDELEGHVRECHAERSRR